MRTVQKRLGEITQGEIARRVGVSRALVSRIIRGQRKPSLDVAVKMASEIGCTLDDLAAFLHDADARRAAA